MRGGTVRARNEAAVSMNPLVDTAVCVRLVRSRKDTSSSVNCQSSRANFCRMRIISTVFCRITDEATMSL